MDKLTLLLLMMLGPLGCASSGLEPEMTKAADHAAYAKRHPDRLQAATARLTEDLQTAERLSGELEAMPEKLKDPDWALVGEVFRLADADGQSAHYAELSAANTTVQRFYSEREQELKRRVGGAVQYQAKQKDCDIDAYSAAAVGLDKAMEQQLTERAREQSSAHEYLDLNAEKVGKKNLDALREQADLVIQASYTVHIALVKDKAELDRLLDDSSAAQGTLDDRLEELQQQTPPDKPAERKRYDELLEQLQAARAAWPASVEAAKAAQKDAEQRIRAAREKYRASLDGLDKGIEARREAAGKPES